MKEFSGFLMPSVPSMEALNLFLTVYSDKHVINSEFEIIFTKQTCGTKPFQIFQL